MFYTVDGNIKQFLSFHFLEKVQSDQFQVKVYRSDSKFLLSTTQHQFISSMDKKSLVSGNIQPIITKLKNIWVQRSSIQVQKQMYEYMGTKATVYQLSYGSTRPIFIETELPMSGLLLQIVKSIEFEGIHGFFHSLLDIIE